MTRKTIRKNDNQNNKERKSKKPRKFKQEKIFEGELDNKQRSEFRRTKRWILHRLHIKKLQKGLDYITQKPLRKGFTCHHLSSKRDMYTVLSDELQVDLNRGTHDILHTLYTWRCKNPQAITKLLELIEKMYIMNEGKDFE